LKHDLKSYVPDYYDGVLEMDVLMETEQPDIDELYNNISTMDNADPDSLPNRGALDNQFIQTSDVDKVTLDENLFSIIADPTTETLDFRRTRLLNRFSQRPPFTVPWLKQQLDVLIGVGHYTLDVDWNNYTIYIASSAQNQSYYQEVVATIGYVKPCNMVFISQPLVLSTVTAAEEIYLLSYVYNYHVGTTWVLGEKPFASFQNNPPTYNYELGTKWQLGANPFASYNGELIKLNTQPSIQETLLTGIAAFTTADITQVRINGTLIINDFVAKVSSGVQAIVEYNVTPDQVDVITLVELLDVNSNVLTSSPVYVPIILGVRMTHKITIKEGN
jgi:hypothetical protein